MSISPISEKLIELVWEHPILYNSSHADYMSVRKKDRVWAEIGSEVNETGECVKKKWKNLKDTYVKYLRSRSNGGQGNFMKYKKWAWAKHMERFKYFFSNKSKSAKAPDDDGDCVEIIDSDAQSDAEPTVEHQPVKLDTSKVKKLSDITISTKRKYENVDDNASSFDCTNKINGSNFSIDLIFKGYAQSVKEFSPTRQAYTKLKIAQIIAQQEVEHHQEQLLKSVTLPSRTQKRFRANSASSTGSGSDPLDVSLNGTGTTSYDIITH